MADYVEVVDAGPGWTKVRTSDGQVVTVEGNRNWRNNNPGNIEYGNFARSMGAIGTDGRFAVFPTYDAGREAKSNLIFESPNYRNLSIADAINRYAPPVENNTQSYINQVVAAAGVPSSTAMNSLTPSQRAAVLDAMQRVEGWRVGTINGARPPAGAGAPPIMAYAAPRQPTPAAAATANVASGQQGRGFFGNLVANVRGAVPQMNMPTISPQMQRGALAPLLGTVAGRTALWNAFMPRNIGAAPTITQGHSGPGTRAYAVNSSGINPIMLSSSRNNAGRGTGMDTNSHMNMDVYRANASVLGGGGFTQSNIDRALSEGRTLVRLA